MRSAIWNDLASMGGLMSGERDFVVLPYFILSCLHVGSSCSITVAKKAIARHQISVDIRRSLQVYCFFLRFACAITRDVNKARISHRDLM